MYFRRSKFEFECFETSLNLHLNNTCNFIEKLNFNNFNKAIQTIN